MTNAITDSEPQVSPGFRIELRPAEAANQLILGGAINLDAAARLREVVLAAANPAKDVLIDWSEAGHVGAGALQLLIALRAALAAGGHGLAVGRDNSGVRRTLELTGLSGLFPVQETPE